jgi:hypothetical protein
LSRWLHLLAHDVWLRSCYGFVDGFALYEIFATAQPGADLERVMSFEFCCWSATPSASTTVAGCRFANADDGGGLQNFEHFAAVLLGCTLVLKASDDELMCAPENGH